MFMQQVFFVCTENAADEILPANMDVDVVFPFEPELLTMLDSNSNPKPAPTTRSSFTHITLCCVCLKLSVLHWQQWSSDLSWVYPTSYSLTARDGQPTKTRQR